MKPYSLLLFFALITTAPLLAQTEKGSGILSGGISVASANNRIEPGNTSLFVTPTLTLTVGKFVKDNWLVGLSASANTTFGTYKNSSGVVVNTYQAVPVNATPFVRYYQQVGPVQLFGGAGIRVGTNNIRTKNKPTVSAPFVINKTTDFSVSPHLEAGANYFLTKRLSLQATASANALPMSVGSFGLGLVYWTGTGSTATQPTGTANPQTDRGRWLVEGNLGLSSNKTATELPLTSQSQFTISPSVGYFIQKNTIIGVSFPLVFSSSEQVQQGGRTTTARSQTLGISPYYQHYWANSRLTPFTRIMMSYARFGSSINGSPMRHEVSSVGASGSIGLAYMVGKRFIVETSLLNASVSRSVNSNGAASSKTTSASLSGRLGSGFSLRYVL